LHRGYGTRDKKKLVSSKTTWETKIQYKSLTYADHCGYNYHQNHSRVHYFDFDL